MGGGNLVSMEAAIRYSDEHYGPQRKRAALARRTAEACGKCGGGLAAGERVFFRVLDLGPSLLHVMGYPTPHVTASVPLCAPCGGPVGASDIELPCESCRRPMAEGFSWRRPPHRYCSERCRTDSRNKRR